MVPDDNVHLNNNRTFLGTRDRLILDIAIASYSITRFSILSLYFILQVKPRLETIQGAPPPHQTAGNVRNGNLFQSSKGGLQKKIGYRYYSSQYRVFPSLFFCPYASNDDPT